MTQHTLQEHIDEDRSIMRRLMVVVGVFIVASTLMAIAVAGIFG